MKRFATTLLCSLLWLSAAHAQDHVPFELLEAIRNNDLSAIVGMQLDPDARSNEGYSALHIAAKYGRSDIIRHLIDIGFDIDASDNTGYTPLFFAVYARDLGSVQLLIKKGANVFIEENKGMSAIHWAASLGHVAAMKALIDAGADVNQPISVTRTTPLQYAAAYQPYVEPVDFLLRNGANPNAIDDKGRSPLHYAAAACYNPTMVRSLVEGGANVHRKDDKGRTAEEYAELAEKKECVSLLKELASNR